MFVGMVVAFLVVVTGISSLQLKQKNMQYAIREAQLDMEIQAEKQRSEEIEELKEYVQTDEFIRNTAREKLGMADPEEIIFKQR